MKDQNKGEQLKQLNLFVAHMPWYIWCLSLARRAFLSWKETRNRSFCSGWTSWLLQAWAQNHQFGVLVLTCRLPHDFVKIRDSHARRIHVYKPFLILAVIYSARPVSCLSNMGTVWGQRMRMSGDPRFFYFLVSWAVPMGSQKRWGRKLMSSMSIVLQLYPSSWFCGPSWISQSEFKAAWKLSQGFLSWVEFSFPQIWNVWFITLYGRKLHLKKFLPARKKRFWMSSSFQQQEDGISSKPPRDHAQRRKRRTYVFCLELHFSILVLLSFFHFRILCHLHSELCAYQLYVTNKQNVVIAWILSIWHWSVHL